MPGLNQEHEASVATQASRHRARVARLHRATGSSPAAIDAPENLESRLRDRIAGDFVISGHQIRITASIGVAIHPDQGARWDTLLRHADVDMYRDKAAGRGARRPWTGERARSRGSRDANLDPVLAAIVDERNAGVPHVDAI